MLSSSSDAKVKVCTGGSTSSKPHDGARGGAARQHRAACFEEVPRRRVVQLRRRLRPIARGRGALAGGRLDAAARRRPIVLLAQGRRRCRRRLRCGSVLLRPTPGGRRRRRRRRRRDGGVAPPAARGHRPDGPGDAHGDAAQHCYLWSHRRPRAEEALPGGATRALWFRPFTLARPPSTVSWRPNLSRPARGGSSFTKQCAMCAPRGAAP